MRRTISAALAAAAALALTAPAQSADGPPRLNMTRAAGGYVYFNRPGADQAAHDADLKACIAVSNGGFTLDPSSSINPGGLMGHAMGGAGVYSAEKGRRAANVESCMIVRGWRLVRVPLREGERLVNGPRATLAEALAGWIGAETPHGEIIRTWNNDLTRVETIVVGQPMAVSGDVLDVLLLGDGARPDPAELIGGGIAFGVQKPTGQAPRARELTSPAELKPGEALVIYRAQGARKYWRTFYMLQPEGPSSTGDPDLPLATVVTPHPPKGEAHDRVGLYAVQPGVWRVRHFRAMTDFCLGSPAFEARAGDVLYLGGFTFGEGQIGPDMTLDPARAALASAPDLAGRLRPAPWVNGSTGACGLWFNYALEFDGFPYADGYRWGGAAARRAQP